MHFLSQAKALVLSVFFSVVSFSSISSMELITAHSVSSSEPVQLFSNHRDIFVQDENAAYRVEKHNMNPLLQEVMKRKAMGEFTDGGYIRVKQLSDGKYALEAKVRGDGGGYLTGQIASWTVRIGGYGSYAVACYFNPHLVVEAHVVHEAIEASAATAFVVGASIVNLP